MYGARQMHQNVTQDKGMQRGVSKDRNTEGSDWQGRDWSWEQPPWEELWSWEELPMPTFSRAFLSFYYWSSTLDRVLSLGQTVNKVIAI